MACLRIIDRLEMLYKYGERKPPPTQRFYTENKKEIGVLCHHSSQYTHISSINTCASSSTNQLFQAYSLILAKIL